MSTDNQVQAKRAKIDALRQQRNDAKRSIVNADTDASRNSQLASLDAEEQSLQAELASLRSAGASAPAAPAPKPSSPDAAKNKE